ncbi:M12 family metallopeptidase [Luteolibacter soli]|uniref:M12 family metallopeptidase n=1 Tax=Luteolibacter soli TaxID=3135280 RepID=A0ABU9AVN5_9BACT
MKSSTLAASLLLFGTLFFTASCTKPNSIDSATATAAAAAGPVTGKQPAASILDIPCIAPEGTSDSKAFGDPRFFWKNKHSFTVSFLNGPPAVHQMVMSQVRDWTRTCNVTFTQVSADTDADFHVGFDPDGGHWSYIGTSCDAYGKKAPTMNLAINQYSPEDDVRRVVLHEFGHALGLKHEHQHPKSPIVWNEAAVIRYYSGPPNGWDIAKIRTNVLNKYTGPMTGTPNADLHSIMHYPVPKQLTRNNVSVGWNRRISTIDTQFMVQKYGSPAHR